MEVRQEEVRLQRWEGLPRRGGLRWCSSKGNQQAKELSVHVNFGSVLHYKEAQSWMINCDRLIFPVITVCLRPSRAGEKNLSGLQNQWECLLGWGRAYVPNRKETLEETVCQGNHDPVTVFHGCWTPGGGGGGGLSAPGLTSLYPRYHPRQGNGFLWPTPIICSTFLELGVFNVYLGIRIS